MRTVDFHAYGHPNVIGEHKTTLEITTEEKLTSRGTCIIGVRTTQTLRDLDDEIKTLAKSTRTQIQLTMSVDNLVEKVTGRGSPELTYSDSISMVARTSSYECGRTVMVGADRVASDLDRRFVQKLSDPDIVIKCRLSYVKR
ncbi:MAG: DUF371 domain-containing protein [Candidatus Thorarchaeota archaeon]|jgi:hypothetical protein|nr:DUF371 domain-containing protein [Candidatus Thorarchaeota archaeon]